MIFRSAARPPRSGSFPLRRAPRPGDIPPQIEKPCARSRLHKILQPTPAKCQPLYSAPRAPPRHDPPPPARAPSYALTRDLCPCALMFRDAPVLADSRHCLRFGFCALARRPRGRSRPRTRHKSRTPRYKNQFSNIAPKSLFARQRREPATTAAASRPRRAMGREPDPLNGQERRKAPKTTLENSHFYKTSLKSGFFKSTILSKSSKSRVVLGDKGGQTAGDGRAEAFFFFV